MTSPTHPQPGPISIPTVAGQKPTRLLLVSHYFPPHVGGIEQAVQTQAEHLARAGYDVTVITTAVGGPVGQQTLEPDLRLRRVPTNNAIEDRTRIPFPVIGLRAAGSLFTSVRRSDIVHVHDLLYMTTWLAVLFGVLLRKRLFLTQHVHMIEHPRRLVMTVQALVYSVIGRLILPRVERTFYLNATVHDFLVGLGAHSGRLAFVPNIVDTDSFRPASSSEVRGSLRARYGLPLDDVLVLFVGRFVPKKGFQKVVAAASEHYSIVMVGGEGPPGPPDPTSKVFWLGSRDRTEVSELYQACDIFILPSVSEGFPLTVQEAMSSGMAVVTSDDPGYRLYNLDREQVRLITPELPEIRNALELVAGDHEMRLGMSGYSRSYAVEQFSAERYVKALTDAYLLSEEEDPTEQTIAVVTPYYAPSVGGVQSYARQIATRLDLEGGVRPVVVTTGTTRFTIQRDDVDGVLVYRLPVALRLSNTPLHPTWIWMMRRIFTRERVAVINSHAPVPALADAAMIAAGRRPVIATYHSGSMIKGGSPVDPLLRFYEASVLPLLFRRARTVVTVSPTTLGHGRPNGQTISPGVDPELFAPDARAASGSRVLYVGRMDETSQWKGVDVLIEAFARLRARLPEAQLCLVGQGDDVPRLKRLANVLGCGDDVTFVGQLHGSQLVQEYQRAGVLVLPSLTDAESFGMTLIEAMACGCPVIGSRVGGIQHLITDGEDGMLVSPGDVPGLAEACRRVLTEPELSAKLATNGRQTAELRYSWKSRLDQWMSLLRPADVIRRPTSAGRLSRDSAGLATR